MLETTLPKAIPLSAHLQTSAELPVIKIRRPEEKKGPEAEATVSIAPRVVSPEANFAQLQAVLAQLGKAVEQAQQHAHKAGQVQQECFERAQNAESEKTRLEQENIFLRARLQELESRVPRWVRKLCGV